MAEPARKLSPDELPQLHKRSSQAGNIVDFNQKKRNLRKAQLTDQRAKTDQELANQYKEGTPMQGVFPSYAGGSADPEQKTAGGPASRQSQEDPGQQGQGAPQGSQQGQASRQPGQEAPPPSNQDTPQQPRQTPGQQQEQTSPQPQDKAENEKRDTYNKQTADNQPLGDVASRQKKPDSGEDQTGQKNESASDAGETPDDRGRKKNLKSEQKKDKKKKDKGKKKDGLIPKKTGKTGLIGKILFFLLLVFAILIDILPFVTGGFSAIVDWILDIIFWIAVTMVLFIITNDIIGSMIGKRGAINSVQTIAEFIPAIDALPFHTVALVIIYLDLEYDIFSKVTKFKKLKKLVKT